VVNWDTYSVQLGGGTYCMQTPPARAAGRAAVRAKVVVGAFLGAPSRGYIRGKDENETTHGIVSATMKNATGLEDFAVR
jgi:hypothetical protein